jgi:hypothetical protein
MAWQHPTVTLEVGTLDANVRRVLDGDEGLSSEVIDCIHEAVKAAAAVKKHAQQLIGLFIERMKDTGEVKDSDRTLMDHLCARIKPKGQDDEDEDEDEDNCTDSGKGSVQERFLLSFLTYLYSGNYPRATGVGKVVNNFINRLQDLGLHTPRPRSAINVSMPFTPSVLVRSTATQLSTELKKMYRNGSHDLYDKVRWNIIDCYLGVLAKEKLPTNVKDLFINSFKSKRTRANCQETLPFRFRREYRR